MSLLAPRTMRRRRHAAHDISLLEIFGAERPLSERRGREDAIDAHIEYYGMRAQIDCRHAAKRAAPGKREGAPASR